MEEPRTKALYDSAYDWLRPRGTAQIVLRGRPFWVDADARGLAPKLLLLGSYEPHLSKLFLSLAKPSMVVVDIGANIGYYTALAAERVRASGRVLAFEPDPQNFSLLSLNARSFPNTLIDLWECALSDHEGRATLFRDYRSSSRSTLGREVVRKPGGEVDVPLRCLDTCVASLDRPVDLIKIDTEGSEGTIVRGGLHTIARCMPVIMMEFWPFALRANKTDPQALLDLLAGLGYEFFLATQDSTLQAAQPDHLVDLAVAKLASGQGHLDLVLLPSGTPNRT